MWRKVLLTLLKGVKSQCSEPPTFVFRITKELLWTIVSLAYIRINVFNPEPNIQRTYKYKMKYSSSTWIWQKSHDFPLSSLEYLNLLLLIGRTPSRILVRESRYDLGDNAIRILLPKYLGLMTHRTETVYSINYIQPLIVIVLG